MLNWLNARWHRWRHFGEVLALGSIAASLAAGAAHAAEHASVSRPYVDLSKPSKPIMLGDSEILYLEVMLNQTRQPQLLRFERRGERFLARVQDLRRLGFILADQAPESDVPLDSLPDVQVEYDASKQKIFIDAPISLLSLSTTYLNSPDREPYFPASSSVGALLNYDVYASHDGDLSSISAVTEVRAFGLGNAVVSNTAVSRAFEVAHAGSRNESVRLETSVEWSFPESAVTVTVGDAFSGFLGWTRPVRMAGVQIGRNYGLQPYRVTTPMPQFLGEVSVPSTVELYVNGMRQYSGSLPTGPFELTTVPGISGAGFAEVVVTDAFGRARTLGFPFYATQQLLADGLSDWSFSVGTVREDYGIRSFSYADELVVSGNIRYGFSDTLTLEAQAEGGGDLSNGGVGGVWQWGGAGVFSLSHAVSELNGERGSQINLAYAWNSQRFNFSFDTQRTRGDYRDIASLYGPLPPRISERMLAGVRLGALGMLSASHIRLEYAEPEHAHARYAGLFWTRSFPGGWSLNASFNQNLEDSSDHSYHLSLLMPLGGERRLSSSVQNSSGRTDVVADLARTIPGDGGYGWRMQARHSDGDFGGLLEAGWLGEHGRIGGGVARVADYDYGYAQASGGLVWMGGQGFASRTVNDAFAVVSTEGMAGVPVKLENRVIGHTGERGTLLVTPLNAWQRNKLSIDPMDLPANTRVAQVDQFAVPSDRAGTHVHFAVTPVRAALLMLRDAGGQPLPLGSRVELEGAADEGIIGYDGETYLEGLEPNNRLRVRTPDGPCLVEFTYPAVTATIPRIGPLTCQEESAQ